MLLRLYFFKRKWTYFLRLEILSAGCQTYFPALLSIVNFIKCPYGDKNHAMEASIWSAQMHGSHYIHISTQLFTLFYTFYIICRRIPVCHLVPLYNLLCEIRYVFCLCRVLYVRFPPEYKYIIYGNIWTFEKLPSST